MKRSIHPTINLVCIPRPIPKHAAPHHHRSTSKLYCTFYQAITQPVRGPPVSIPEPSPRQSTRSEAHQTEMCTQARSGEVTPRSRHEIRQTEQLKYRPGYHSTGEGRWGAT